MAMCIPAQYNNISTIMQSQIKAVINSNSVGEISVQNTILQCDSIVKNCRLVNRSINQIVQISAYTPLTVGNRYVKLFYKRFTVLLMYYSAMITLPIIIIISLFITDITATPYCDQQLRQFRLVTKNLNRKCPLATTNVASCCDLSAYRIPQPTPAVYKINCCWCDAPFEAAKVYCDPCGSMDGDTEKERWF